MELIYNVLPGNFCFIFYVQAADIACLRQDKVVLMEQEDGLEIHAQKMAEEASYAKEWASAAALEL